MSGKSLRNGANHGFAVGAMTQPCVSCSGLERKAKRLRTRHWGVYSAAEKAKMEIPAKREIPDMILSHQCEHY